MKRSVPLIALLLATTTACGGADNSERSSADSGSRDMKAYDVSEEPPPAAPGITPTAAPGVAFNYRYAFRLPAQRIAAVQEQHAQACEKLGIDRCRITGMLYRLVNERDIEGMLAFKLDPAIARQFGKSGVEAVTRSEGMLTESEITGVDAGAAIERANSNEAEIEDELRRINEQLAQPGLAAAERMRLQSEALQLRQSARANRSTREEQQASLATTPMVFHYGSGDLVPGFDTRSPIRDAIETAGDNMIGGIAMLFVILLTMLPWVAVAALLWWLFRRFGPGSGLVIRRGPRGNGSDQSSDVTTSGPE